MKKFLAVFATLALIPSLSFAFPKFAGKSGGRSVSTGRGMAGRSGLGASGRFSLGGQSSFKSSGVSQAGFRNLAGRNVDTGTGGTNTGGNGATAVVAPPPTYSMIGATIHSPGMFSTQVPIIETRGFQYTDAGGVRYGGRAIDQSEGQSRGVFTDATMSGYNTGSSGGYGTLFAGH